jgi:hypothetical protein
MKLPATKDSLVLRTDFTDEAAWQAVCTALQQPSGGFKVHVDIINDPAFAGIEAQQLPALPTEAPNRSHAFLIDHVALHHPEKAILVVDLLHAPGRTFRVIPAEVGAVAVNLALANMDFCDFADAVDQDGIFRGFPARPQRPPLPKPSFWKRLFP